MIQNRIFHMTHTSYKLLTVSICLVIVVTLTEQLLHGMELEIPESYKKLLINNASDLDKKYISTNRVTWHKSGNAYTFIHQKKRHDLLFKLVFYEPSDQQICTRYYHYYEKDHPIYPLPNDYALPQFNDNDEAYFHADGYIKIPDSTNFYRMVILYILPTDPTRTPKAMPCRIGLPYNKHTGKIPTCRCTYLLPFKSLLTAVLASSKTNIEDTNLHHEDQHYAENDQTIVYEINGIHIPDNYALCTLCKHLPQSHYKWTKIHYFEDLPKYLSSPIIKQYIKKQSEKKTKKEQKNNTKYLKQGSQQPTNINDLLKNNAVLLKELVRLSTNKDKYCHKLNDAENTLLQALQTNVFNYYPSSTCEYAVTIINNVIARDAIIKSIQNNNIKDFIQWTTSNPTALNIHSPVLNDGTPVHLIIQRITQNDYSEFLEIAIKHNANFNRLDRYGRTPLFYAVINKNVAVAQQLIKNGASTWLEDHTQNTLMHYAVCQNKQGNDLNKQKEVINFCLKNTQMLNVQNNFGNTPVHLALLGDIDQELLEILFSNIINFSLKNKNNKTLQLILQQKPLCEKSIRLTRLIDTTLQQKTQCSCTEKFKEKI